jgi:hypothetical protein
MTPTPRSQFVPEHDEQFASLLVDRALWGLDESEERSLREGLGEEACDREAASFDRAVAALAVALSVTDEPVPASLKRSLSAAGEGFAAGRAEAGDLAGGVAGRIGPAGPVAWLGWLVAAAALALAAILATPSRELSIEERLARLESSSPSLVRAAWLGLGAIGAPAHTLDRGVSGEVIWSESADEGFMRIAGIEPNDPREFQYQLWIFDASRPTGDLPEFRAEGLPEILTQRPIDGGVFDVTAGGEVIVPIDAKLPVGEGVLFAVTRERPGGVVQSERDIVFLALKG